MSVQNIIDPATGQIDNRFINVAALGVVTNPLTATLQGQTAYGLTDANVVSTGVLQTDNIQAYSVLPGAPIAVTSPVKLQAPADRIDMEKVGVNTIAVPDGSLVLTATDPATTTATAYLDQGSLRVENGINAPSIFANAGSGYNAALSASAGGQITSIQANAPAQQLAIVADVANTKNIVNAVGQPLDIQTNAGDITMKPSTGSVKVGTTGDLIAGSGYFGVFSQGANNLTMESTGGNVNISCATGDTSLTASVNGGIASLTLTDAGSVGSATLKSNNEVKMEVENLTSATLDTSGRMLIKSIADDRGYMRVEGQGGKGGSIITDESIGSCRFEAEDGLKAVVKTSTYNTRVEIDPAVGSGETVSIISNTQPTLRFEEAGGASVKLVAIPTGSEIQASCAFFKATSGAIEGVQIGSDATVNMVAGNTNSLPMVVAHDLNDYNHNFVKFQSGTTDVNGSSSVQVTVGGIAPSFLADATSSKLLIDTATASAGLQYDGVSATPVQWHFNSADFISGASSGSSGQHLRIFVNGTEYKIKLENA